MTDLLSIPASYIVAMLDLADERGMDRAQLIADVGLDPQALATEQACSAISYGQLHHRIIRDVGDEWFGLLSGGPVPKGAISFLCRLMVHCKTLEDAIKQSSEFFELARGFKVKQEFTVEDDVVTFKISKLDYLSDDEFEHLMANTSMQVIRATLAAWHGFVSWLIGIDVPLTALYYSFSSSTTSDNKGRYPVYYDHSFSGYSCDSKYLKMPILQCEENVSDFVIKAPYYAFIKTAKNPDTVQQRVKSVITKSMGGEFPQALEVSKILNMSVTTLHRKLSQEHTSFQKIKDQARMQAAIHYLSSPDMSTAAIAELVGFEDPSAFYRSFKKWTGLPPGEYRKTMSAA